MNRKDEERRLGEIITELGLKEKIFKEENRKIEAEIKRATSEFNSTMKRLKHQIYHNKKLINGYATERRQMQRELQKLPQRFSYYNRKSRMDVIKRPEIAFSWMERIGEVKQ
jgi:hypothetical protein